MIAALVLLVASLAPAPSTNVEGVGACGVYAPFFKAYGMDPERAVRICWRESRGDPWAHNGDDAYEGSFGIMQINAVHLRDIELHPDKWPMVHMCGFEELEDLYNPWTNVCVAGNLYRRAGGWDPWRL